MEKGKLYLVATPIGNLGDITYRGIEALTECDLIAAEDTRNSLKLCNHFDIKKPMTSYHEHNKYEKADTLIGMMREGKTIALISDAGTPAISDPGEVLVKRCHEEGIGVTSLPGACAAITALTLSGLSTRRFVFEGFLPADKKEKREVLESIKNETRTIVMYEAPHRLIKTLNELREAIGDRRLTICRELTKVHEEILPISIDEAIEKYKSIEPVFMESIKDDIVKEEYIPSNYKIELVKVSTFKEAIDYAAKKDVPLYCGEYGVIEYASAEDTKKWYLDIHSVLTKYGIGRALWSYKEMDFDFKNSKYDGVRKDIINS